MAITQISFGSLTTAALYLALLLAPYYLTIFAFRFFHHPLSKYPGPFLASISDAYNGYYALLARLHLVTYRDLAKYGPVMRHGPNKLVFNSAQALRDIYCNERVTKSHVYLLTQHAPDVFNIFNAVDRRQHRIRRKLIGQAVTERSMRMFEPTMTKQINIYLNQILVSTKGSSKQPNRTSGSSSSPVNMTERFKRLGLDIVCLLAFGYPLKTQTEDKYRFVISGLQGGNYRSNSFMQWPRFKKMRIDNILHALTFVQRKRYLRMMETMISTRLAQETHVQDDLYSFVADNIDTGDGKGSIRLGQLWSEALFFFPAGGDTTSTALTALFFYLSRNPPVYARLADEIRTTFPTSGKSIKGGPQLASCRYLRACIDETLRMSPSVPGTLWRELAPEEVANGPLMVDGHVIAPGVQVGVNVYSLHHNVEYFDDPFTFKPERWLTEDEALLKQMHSAFAAFSVGYRGCAGKAMAYLEMSLVVARTLWYFDFGVTKDEKLGMIGAGGKGKGEGRAREGEFQLYDIFASGHDGPVLEFQRRGEGWRELEDDLEREVV